MASQRTLDKKFEVVDGNVVINEVVEKTLTLEDLQKEKAMYEQGQKELRQEIERLGRQHGELQGAIVELDDMIAALTN